MTGAATMRAGTAGAVADLAPHIRRDPARRGVILELSADGVAGPGGYHGTPTLIGEE